MSGIIDISEIKEEKCVEWNIPQFFHDTIIKYKSRISVFEKNWILLAYPRGACGTKPEYVILTVILLLPDSEFSVNVLLDAKGSGRGIECKTQDKNSDSERYRIWTWLYKSSKLKLMLDDDVLRGRVIISCNEENSKPPVTVDAACETTFLSNTIHFCRDFQGLYISGQNSDVSIEVQGRLFKVHRFILGACSPVFSAMFDHDMLEKNKGIVKVDDCHSDTFQNFLKCLYSGKLENISPESLIDLYKVSDKYCVPNLKEKCSEIMMKELSKDTVCEVLAVADLLNDTQLKASAETFLIKNFKMVLRTETWKKLQSENSSLASECLAKVFEDYNP